MYLTRKSYLMRDYKEIDGKWQSVNHESVKVEGIPLLNRGIHGVKEISEEAAYWRKANHIHAWFVENVQNGEDECREHEVSLEQLAELVDLCKRVLADHALAPELLPTQGGFFFGSTDYDEGYYWDLQNTIDQLEPLIEFEKANPPVRGEDKPDIWVSYEYCSSW